MHCIFRCQHSRRNLVLACVLILVVSVFGWAGVRFRQSAGDRALIAAIKRSDATEVERLLAAGASPDARDVVAQDRGYLEALRELFRHAPAKPRRTALMLSSGACPVQITQALIASGASVNAVDMYGDTALMAAAYDGKCIDDLAYTHEINTIDETGASRSVMAAHSRDAETAHALIEAGADVNVKDVHGFTALILSTDCDNVDCARVLIESGADLDARDNWGQSALDWAETFSHLRVSRALTAALAGKQKHSSPSRLSAIGRSFR